MQTPSIKTPPFLEALAIDRPDLAKEIEARIPAWRKEIDQLFGINGLADKFLGRIRYFSAKETVLFIERTAQEIESVLAKNSGQKVGLFVREDSSSSGHYFANKIINYLESNSTSNNTDRIVIVPFGKKIETGNIETCFYADDSSNEAIQMMDFFRLLKCGKIDQLKNLHLRLIAITDYARDHIESVLMPENKTIENISLNGAKMPTNQDFLAEYPIVGNKFMQIIADSHPSISETALRLVNREILGIFYHTFQDNLNYLMIPNTDIFNKLPMPKTHLLERKRTGTF